MLFLVHWTPHKAERSAEVTDLLPRKDPEVQRGEVTCQKLHSQKVSEPSFDSWMVELYSQFPELTLVI